MSVMLSIPVNACCRPLSRLSTAAHSLRVGVLSLSCRPRLATIGHHWRGWLKRPSRVEPEGNQSNGRGDTQCQTVTAWPPAVKPNWATAFTSATDHHAQKRPLILSYANLFTLLFSPKPICQARLQHTHKHSCVAGELVKMAPNRIGGRPVVTSCG